MSNIPEYKVEAALKRLHEIRSNEGLVLTDEGMRSVLEAADSAKAPEPVEEVVCTDDMKRVGEDEVYKAYVWRTGAHWYKTAAINTYTAMHRARPKPREGNGAPRPGAEVIDEAVAVACRAALGDSRRSGKETLAVIVWTGERVYWNSDKVQFPDRRKVSP